MPKLTKLTETVHQGERRGAEIPHTSKLLISRRKRLLLVSMWRQTAVVLLLLVLLGVMLMSLEDFRAFQACYPLQVLGQTQPIPDFLSCKLSLG